MKKSVNFVLILVLVLYVAGCAAITPRTADLQNVHQLYRQEFLSSAIPQSPNDQKDIACQPNDEAFAQTLRAIRDYQVKYPQTDSRLTQHLYVLQAMIYLQSGRPSMAGLLKTDVSEAASKLESGTGIATRAVGMIADPHQAEEIIASGKADMVALARGLIDNPRWPWHAAEALGAEMTVPPQYLRGHAPNWPGAKLARPGG